MLNLDLERKKNIKIGKIRHYFIIVFG